DRRTDREIGAGAEVLLARGGEHDATDREVDVRVAEPADQPVAHVVGDRVPGLGAVDREPEHAGGGPREQFLLGTGLVLVDPRFTTKASSATAPRRRTTNGFTSSSPMSSARSIASRCTFMIASNSAPRSKGFAPRTPSSIRKPRSSRTM